jgi:NADPH:quinone reductase-like Zn-dependent oxidoreductase
MKAIRLHSYGPPENLIYETAPDPVPGPDDVLIDVVAVAVNPADWKIRAGYFAALNKPFPTVLGWDFSGTIGALGSNVDKALLGKRVVCKLSAMVEGAYAEKAIAPAALVVIVPDELDMAQAAVVPLAGLTGAQMIDEVLKVTAGQRVLITGALGSVGRASVYAANKAGATVIAGVRASQVDQARAMTGVDEVLDLSDLAAVAALEPVDVLADTIGGKEAESILPRIKAGGSAASAVPFASFDGNPAASHILSHPSFAVRPDAVKLTEIISDVARGAFSIPIARRLPLSDAAQAQALVEQGGLGGKIVLIVRETA